MNKTKQCYECYDGGTCRNEDIIDDLRAELREVEKLIGRIFEMADSGTSAIDIDPSSPLWQIEADTHAWIEGRNDTRPTAAKCKKCDGCGKIANTDDQEPWTVWTGLPLNSATAVLIGLVTPITCPECGGTGKSAKHSEKTTAHESALKGSGGTVKSW